MFQKIVAMVEYKDPKKIRGKGAQLGTGIWLFLVKTVIEKNMGGTVDAYNEEDGLTVEISLPIYESKN